MSRYVFHKLVHVNEGGKVCDESPVWRRDYSRGLLFHVGYETMGEVVGRLTTTPLSIIRREVTLQSCDDESCHKQRDRPKHSPRGG